MGMKEQETRCHLIDPILRKKGYDDIKWLKCETPAPVEPMSPAWRLISPGYKTDASPVSSSSSGAYKPRAATGKPAFTKE